MHLEQPAVHATRTSAPTLTGFAPHCSNMTYKSDALKRTAVDAGAATEWLEGLTTARAAAPSDPQREIESA